MLFYIKQTKNIYYSPTCIWNIQTPYINKNFATPHHLQFSDLSFLRNPVTGLPIDAHHIISTMRTSAVTQFLLRRRDAAAFGPPFSRECNLLSTSRYFCNASGYSFNRSTSTSTFPRSLAILSKSLMALFALVLPMTMVSKVHCLPRLAKLSTSSG